MRLADCLGGNFLVFLGRGDLVMFMARLPGAFGSRLGSGNVARKAVVYAAMHKLSTQIIAMHKTPQIGPGTVTAGCSCRPAGDSFEASRTQEDWWKTMFRSW
ncbi:MAG: hypothetical protein ACRD3W_25300, partial [Terriglobales bacterium]